MTSDLPAIAQPLLRITAVLYGVATRVRNAYYDRPRNQHRAELPVVSVGNLTVGGTGKTPLVHWLATQLAERGRRPAVVSRGYGGRAGRGPLTVSTGAGPLVEAALCGDEPHMLAASTSRIPIVVGADRCRGAEAARELGAELILLDDGFQHRRIARALDIVLLDATNPFGNGRLLPAGPLREPLSSLGRAGIIVLTRSRRQRRTASVEREIRRHNADVPILHAAHRRVGFRDLAGEAVAPPRRAFLFSGIGRPDAFREDVEAEGVDVVECIALRDHQSYDAAAVDRWRERAASRDAALVTTAKDRSRLADPPAGLLTLEIEAEPFDPAPLLAAVERAIAGGEGR